MERFYIIEVARRYATSKHSLCSHFYDYKPYSFHLEKTVEIAKKFIYLIPKNNREEVIAACWCHDLIEDTRQTYNDIKKYNNKQIADIVYALTTEKGKNRQERANKKYYEGIRKTKYATFCKLCDRIANVEYSKERKNKMFEIYKNEHKHFINLLKKPWWEKLQYKENDYKDLFEYINKIML